MTAAAESRRAFAGMAGWNALAWAATTASGLVATALIFRAVGEQEFGVWATILALRGFLLLLDGGLATGIARDVARLGEHATDAWQRVVAARRLYVLGGVFVLALGLLGASLPGLLLGVAGPVAGVAATVAALTAVEAALALFGGPLLAILRGRQRFDLVGSATAVQVLIGLALLALGVERYGTTGAAAALLAARLVVQGALWALMTRRGWLRAPAGAEAGAVAWRPMLAFAWPLWLSAGAAALAIGTDVPVVGAVFGEVAAGHYALGARVPAACIGFLFAVLGAAFPGYVTAERERRRRLASAHVFLAASLAAAGFGVLAFCADDLLAAWIGEVPPLACSVMLVYAAVWTVNAPVHVLASLAIANDSHRVLARIALGSAVANLALSLALAWQGIALGPALASAAVIAATNLWLVPARVLPRIGWRRADYLRPVLLGYLCGGGVAMTVIALHAAAGLPPLPGLALAVLATVGASALLLDLTVRPVSTCRALWHVTVHGGWPVRWRQWREARRLRRTVGPAPYVWTPQAPPLVTVRIATYARGPLVAERAIASALAQTHANLEVVVVGDCCDATTAAAVRSVRDPRVRFVNLPERGRYPDDPELRWMVAGSTPMNHGVELARGEWLAPLDDDDEFTPDHVAVLLEACHERQLDFAWGVAEVEQADGTWTRCGSWPLRHGRIVHAAVMYSLRYRALRHDLAAWRLGEPGDWNLWRRFRAAGARMGFVDHVVARHYVERRELAEATPMWLAAAGRG